MASALTPADHVLINAASSLLIGGIELACYADDHKMIRDILRDILPHVNRDHPSIEALADAVECYFSDKNHGAVGAKLTLSRIYQRRMAEAYDRFAAEYSLPPHDQPGETP